MTLFSSSEIQPEKKEESIGFRLPMPYRSLTTSRMAIGTKNSALRDILGEIEQNETIHLPALAKWSSHELIEYLTTLIGGKCNVYLTSWSVKSTAVKTLLALMSNGFILQLRCVFDPRIKTQCPEAWQLADYNLEIIKLYKCHAKVTVIENEEWGISIVSSANLTRNPRIECYVISTDKNVANFHKQWILDVIDNAEPFS